MSTLKQWNSSANWYDENMGVEGDELNARIIKPEIFRALGELSNKSILDIGCGSGYLTIELAKLAKKVIGTDFAQEFVGLCTKKYRNQKNLEFQQQDATQSLKFDDESFDIVLSKMVLQYVPTLDVFAKESYRVLKSKGELLFAVDHPFHTQFFYAQSLAGKTNPKYEGLEDYFSDSPQTKLSLWGKVELTWFPRTIANYIEVFLKERFKLALIRELAQTKNDVRLPRILLLKFEK